MVIRARFGNSSLSMRDVIMTSIFKGLDQKKQFFERCSYFKFNSLGLALGIALKFYISLAKGLKLKFIKFYGLILTFVKVIRENWQGVFLAAPPTLHLQ